MQEEFASDFIYPMIRAGAIYEGQYFLGTSIARPLIAKRMVEIAKKEKAAANGDPGWLPTYQQGAATFPRSSPARD